MYCANCGAEASREDDVCKNCGEKFIWNTIKVDKKHMPLKWYKFYRYFRLPLSIFTGILNLVGLFSSDYSDEGNIFMTLFITIILFLGLQIFTFILFDYKLGYVLNNILLVVETFYISLASLVNVNNIDLGLFITTLIIISLIWWLPNFIYFKHRKYTFSK